MTAASPADIGQLDLFARGPERDTGLDAGLWTRRHDRRDEVRRATLPPVDAALAPLVLALARMAAQRDARRIVRGRQA